jgi:hypothetical protein
MKNKNLIPVVFFVILIFSACDFITKVYEPQPPPPPATDSTRKILLEDYTGHYCNNCPFAAMEADTIQKKYPDRVIVMGVHVSKEFAGPHKNDEFKADFRTPAGNSYDEISNFNMSGGGLPKGMINRKKYKPNSLEHILLYGSWDEAVYNEINTSPNAIVQLNIENEYDASSRKLNVTIKSTFFYDTIKSNAYSLVVCIIESGIINPQLKGPKHILDYVHNHVLRDNINCTWGKELVAKGKIVKSKELTKNYSYTFPTAYPSPIVSDFEWSQTACVVENCHIVAYIYNNDSKEVVQVSEEKVIQ